MQGSDPTLFGFLCRFGLPRLPVLLVAEVILRSGNVSTQGFRKKKCGLRRARTGAPRLSWRFSHTIRPQPSGLFLLTGLRQQAP